MQSEFRVVIFSVLEGLKSGFRVVAVYLCWYLLGLAVRVQGSNILSFGRVKVRVQGSYCIFMLVSNLFALVAKQSEFRVVIFSVFGRVKVRVQGSCCIFVSI